MSVLFELEDFEETRVEWLPVWEPEPEDFGWTLDGGSNGLPQRCDGTTISKAEWSSFLKAARCRDCGRSCGMNQGGVLDGRSFRVCDECASLDGCLARRHDRGAEWHVSHWGDSHRAHDHDELVRAQARRRTNYLRRTAK